MLRCYLFFQELDKCFLSAFRPGMESKIGKEPEDYFMPSKYSNYH